MSKQSILHSQRSSRLPALLIFAAALPFLLLVFGPASRAADNPEVWIEVRSTHFRVVSNGNEKQARRVAGQFERFREVLRVTLTKSRIDPSTPLLILAVKDEKSLKALIPEYWEKKGMTHPAGLFLRSVSKDFVILRMDADVEDPYHIIYHEYTHSLMSLNFRVLPVWVSEGLAEFFGHATIGDKEAGTGRPSGEQIRLLRENHMLPLATLLTAEKDSPYYNESNKTSLFYAQSWALTHMLMIGGKGSRQMQLIKYVELTSDGMPDLEAAQQAFGDVKQLESKLSDYIRQAQYFYLPVKLNEVPDEKTYAVRSVPEAESLALRGDFLMHNQRTKEALPMLEQSLRLDPNLGIAHESLGFYYFRQGDRAQAAEHFRAAAQFESANFLAHYYFATLSSAQLDPANAELVESHLRKAIELNPAFAPAYSALAGHYASRGSKLEAALDLASKAIRLEPGVMAYHITLANVLLRMERAEDAIKVARNADRAARTDEDREMLNSFKSEITRYQEYLAQKKEYEAGVAAREKQRAEEEARRAAEEKEASEAAKQNTGEAPAPKKPGKAPAAVPVGPGKELAALGKISRVTCSWPAQIDIEIAASAKPVILHSNNYYKIEFYSINWKPPEDFQPCEHLTGLNVKVNYNAVDGKTFAGEIVKIEVRQ
jgi:tetratricopeptide (TPR) repeat protein